MKVEIVDADDWKGLYIDGKLEYEGHEIGIDIFIRCLKQAGVALPFSFDEEFLNGDDLDQLRKAGRFPKQRG